MLHQLIRTWFEWLEAGGYFGIIVLMAMESSIIPVPSEIVMAPAAFWAAQGRMSMVGVIAAGTLGSYIGSLVSYWISSWLGHPMLERYGKYLLISPAKLHMTERWVKQFGAFGIFTARFLPVVRHLISIPAGIFRMPLMQFSIATIVGSGIWCSILAWFGARVLGDNPELLDSPESMIAVIQSKMSWFLGGAVCLATLYIVTVWFKVKQR